MFRIKTFAAALGMLALAFQVPAFRLILSGTPPSSRMNAAGDLEIIDSKGQLVKILSNGSISQTVKADNQAFKVSYGKDLKGRYTTIVYPDPEKPQTLALSVFKQDVSVSSDAVLTVVAEKDLSSATLQSGVLGKISVGGTDLAGGNSLRIQNGTVVANTPPPAAPQVQPAPAAPKPKVAKAAPKTKPAATVKTTTQTTSVEVASDPLPVRSSSEEVISVQAPSHYDGAHTRKVEGDVLIAPKGMSVVDAVKNSPVPPRLDVNEAVAPGSTIQTGPNGKAYVSPFPGAVLMIEPNSTVEFEELSWKNNAGKVEHKITANVKQGSVISAIKGIKPEDLDYKIKTPHGVAAARGTVYITRNGGSSTTVIVSDGKVQVVTDKGTFSISLAAGKKITIAADGPDGPVDLQANADEIRAAELLWAEVQAFIATNDWGSAGSGDGDMSSVAPPELDALIGGFQGAVDPRLNQAPMTPTTSP